MSKLSEALFGKKEEAPGIQAWQQANQQFQNGGGFQQPLDYWRQNLSDTPAAAAAYEAPLKRQFQEETLPGLAHQFAGMGSGGLDSSSFRNAGVRASTDLAERLGAIRAGLRENAASSLSNFGMQNIQNAPFRPETHGLVGNILEGAIPNLSKAATYILGAPGAGDIMPVSGAKPSGNNLFGSSLQSGYNGMRTPYSISS